MFLFCYLVWIGWLTSKNEWSLTRYSFNLYLVLFLKKGSGIVNYGIMRKLYSPDKVVGNFYQYFVTRKQ